MLMAIDRNQSDQMPLTHEFLASMLGRTARRGHQYRRRAPALRLDSLSSRPALGRRSRRPRSECLRVLPHRSRSARPPALTTARRPIRQVAKIRHFCPPAYRQPTALEHSLKSRCDLLIRALANQLQEQSYGGVSRALRRRLQRLAGASDKATRLLDLRCSGSDTPIVTLDRSSSTLTPQLAVRS